MRGQLVIKTETLRGKADGVNFSRYFDEFIRGCLCRASLPRAIISRRSRIFCKGVQNLLMLLLVVQSDLEDPIYVGKLGAARRREQMLNRLIDMPAIRRDLLAAGPGQQPAPRPRVARTGGDII